MDLADGGGSSSDIITTTEAVGTLAILLGAFVVAVLVPRKTART